MRRLIIPILALTVFGCDPESPFYGEDAPPIARDARPGEDAAPTPDAGPIDPEWAPAAAPGGPAAVVQWLNMLEDDPIDLRLDGWVAAGSLVFGDATAGAQFGTDGARLSLLPADGGPAEVMAEVEAGLEAGRHMLVVATGARAAPTVHAVALADPPPAGEPGTVQVLNLAPRSDIPSVWIPREYAVRPGTLSPPVPMQNGELALRLARDPFGGPLHIIVPDGQTAALVLGELDDGRPIARLVFPDGSGDGFGLWGRLRVVDLAHGSDARAVSADDIALETAEPFAVSPVTALPPAAYRVRGPDGVEAPLRARAASDHAALLLDTPDGPDALVVPAGVHDRDRTRATLPLVSTLTGEVAVRFETVEQRGVSAEEAEVRLTGAVPETVELPAWSWGRVTVERAGVEYDFGDMALDDGYPGLLILSEDPDGRPIFGTIERGDSLRWALARRDRSRVRVISVDALHTEVRVPDGPDPFNDTWVSAGRIHRVHTGDVPAGEWTFDMRRRDADVGAWTFDLQAGERTSIFVHHRDDGPSVVRVVEPAEEAPRLVFVNQHDAPVGMMLDGQRVDVPVDGVGVVPGGRDRLDLDTTGDGAADLFLPAEYSHHGALSLIYTGPEVHPGAWVSIEGARLDWVNGLGTVAPIQVVGLPFAADDDRGLHITVGDEEQLLWMRAAHGPLNWRYGADRAHRVLAGAQDVEVVIDDGQRCAGPVDIAPDLYHVLLVRYGDVGCTLDLVTFEPDTSHLYNGLPAGDVTLTVGRGRDDDADTLWEGAVAPGEVSDAYPAIDDAWLGADFDGDGQIDAEGPVFPIQWGGLTLALADEDTWMLLTVMAGGHPISFYGVRP